MKKLWNWLNGKKTTIGGVVTGLTLIASGLFPINPNIVNGVLVLSGTLTGVGVTHKGIKNKEKIKDTIKKWKES